MSDKKNNMELWDAVCETDPEITTKVESKTGKFMFTAICAQNQRQKATELWGPQGGKWGVKDLHYGIIDTEKGREAVLDATFWYPEGEIPLRVGMTFYLGNDTWKKLLTDLTTKALSFLGFNSDVFEGLFDDNKYVAEMRKKFNGKLQGGDGGKPEKPNKPPKDAAPPAVDDVGKLNTMIRDYHIVTMMKNALKKYWSASSLRDLTAEQYPFAYNYFHFCGEAKEWKWDHTTAYEMLKEKFELRANLMKEVPEEVWQTLKDGQAVYEEEITVGGNKPSGVSPETLEKAKKAAAVLAGKGVTEIEGPIEEEDVPPVGLPF